MRNGQANTPLRVVPIDAGTKHVTSLLQRERLISIDLQLTSSEKKILQGLKVEIQGIDGNFLFWGNVENPDLRLNLKKYLTSIGSNGDAAIETVLNLLLRYARSVTRYFDTEFAWVETKTFLANSTFITPRWHTDNKFFKPHTAYKFVWAARGAQTRFGTTESREEFDNLTLQEIQAGHGTVANLQARESINAIVSEFDGNPMLNATLYRSGGEDPVVHSEPHMNESRLFVAIVPGTRQEIVEWHKRKMEKDQKKNVGRRQWHYFSL